MIDETERTDVAALSPRAGVALLSLQLRGTLHDAEEAEREAAAIDTEAALWQLRSRLGPLVDDRRRALAAELDEERAQAGERIAAARADAERLVTDAQRAAEEERARRAADEARRAAKARQDAEELFASRRRAEEAAAMLSARAMAAPPKPELFDDEALDDAAPVDSPPDDAAPVDSPPDDADRVDAEPDDAIDDSAVLPRPGSVAPPPPVALAAPLPPVVIPMDVPDPGVHPDDRASSPAAMHVVIDAEAFAKAFAAAMAPVVESRQQPSQPVLPPYLPPSYTMPPQPAPKKSFWSNAWHPDVLLSGLAMVIVIVVLIAWTG